MIPEKIKGAAGMRLPGSRLKRITIGRKDYIVFAFGRLEPFISGYTQANFVIFGCDYDKIYKYLHSKFCKKRTTLKPLTA